MQALAERSLAIGRDAHGNIIVLGDYNTINPSPDEMPELLLQGIMGTDSVVFFNPFFCDVTHLL